MAACRVMDPIEAIRAVGALVLVLGLILGMAWAVRKYGGRIGMSGHPSRVEDLRVVEFRSLDMRRKLAVVRWGDREHLLCIGPAGDCVVAERPAPTETVAPSERVAR